MQFKRPLSFTAALGVAPLLMWPIGAQAQIVKNPLCPVETAIFAPDQGKDIVVPKGFKVSVFASGLNAPTGIAFLGNKNNFQVFVLESGHGLPSRCNDETSSMFSGSPATNPFTPDILVFDQNGKKIAGPLGKPTDPTSATGGTNVFQPHGPAIDIAFERGLQGGRLFATDSNQSTHTGTAANSSRIVTVNPTTGAVTKFIDGLPTGDHPTEQLAFSGPWIYWSQGSTTNSGVVGLDNGNGTGQPDIPCQDITLSENVFISSLSPLVETSGYSPFGTTNKGGTVKAFTSAKHPGVCDGATLRAKLNAAHPEDTIEPVGWGHRNGYAIRFAPNNHPLAGQLLVGEDGADERGARPSNGAPEVLSVDAQNADGTPVYHGWPDRYGFLASSQAVFNPIGGRSDDLCVPTTDALNPPSFCTPASLANILKFDVPIADVLASPPAPIVAPLAIEAADSSFTGIDFVPKSFVGGPVQDGAALYALEGDFGFSPPNATPPAPEVGHEVKLINFNQDPSAPLSLSFQNFARNNTGDQAFISATNPAAFNRPLNVRFGPDECAYVPDYGAVRDGGGGPPAGPGSTRFLVDADAPLVQFPGTGVIFKICPSQ
jgi:glucose/arabinose dehydrogenase